MEEAVEVINDLAGSYTAAELMWIRTGAAVALALIGLFGQRLVNLVLSAFGKRLRPRLPVWLHTLVESFALPLQLLLRAVLLYCALLAAPLPVDWTHTIWHFLLPVAKALAVLDIAWGLWRAAPMCRQLLVSAENSLDVHTNRTMGRFFENVYRVLVLTFAVLVVLDMFGVPVVSLVAGAGIAGLAISLAAQSTLTNLIAGITLVLEHPFGIGDYIVLGTWEGTVEDISFRSTRLRTPDNVVITVENSKVCSEYIQNTTDRDSRLWTQTMRLPYELPLARVEELCDRIREFLLSDRGVKKDPLVVTVDAVGDDGILLYLRVYSIGAGYIDYLHFKDRINRGILQIMEENGCSFAYHPVSVYAKEDKS